MQHSRVAYVLFIIFVIVKNMKLYFLSIFVFIGSLALAQDPLDSIPTPTFEIGEIEIFGQYEFTSKREERKYSKLEEDMRVVYPFLKLVVTEYERVNKEMMLYNEKKRKEYLKWYEKYVYNNYIGYIVDFTPRQGRLTLKLINLELDESPFALVKQYRNGFRAALWQGAALLLGGNMNAEFNEKELPMVKHILRKLKADAELQQINLGKREGGSENIELFH